MYIHITLIHSFIHSFKLLYFFDQYHCINDEYSYILIFAANAKRRRTHDNALTVSEDEE